MPRRPFRRRALTWEGGLVVLFLFQSFWTLAYATELRRIEGTGPYTFVAYGTSAALLATAFLWGGVFVSRLTSTSDHSLLRLLCLQTFAWAGTALCVGLYTANFIHAFRGGSLLGI